MELSCVFNKLLMNVYTCLITSASITEPNEKIKAIKGAHLAMRNDNDVRGIYFYNTVVECFPRGLNKIFPNLTHLDINNCGLREINREDLIGLGGLEVLRLTQNQLIELPNSLFTDMPSLKSISFYRNKLERLSSKLLEPLLDNNLNCVDFSNNSKIDSVFNLSKTGSAASLMHVMVEIDKHCLEPIDSKPQNEEENQSKYVNMMSEGFAKLWTSSNYSDFVIVVGSREFRVHKNILAMQSSVLEEIIEKDAKERQQNLVSIENLNAVDVEEFLRYLYTGKIQENANAIQLYTIAAKFNVSALKSICEERILNKLDQSNAMEIFMLGHRHSSGFLKLSAFEEVKKIFPDKTLSSDLINKPKHLKEMVETKQKLDFLFGKKLLP